MRSHAVPPPAPLPELSGYEVVRRLGVSATSEVLLAVARGPLGFARTVVLKRLVTETSDGHARLSREAHAYARLSHPAIVRLYDFVEDAGRLTLVLEHVDGVSLKRVMEAGRSARLDDACVWYVGYRIFLALAAAHAAREPMTREFAPVIHRDVSPANVLVPWDGYVKLSDFGIARLAGVAGDTRPGVIKGTAGYLAPEQVRGEALSVRTDVYAACLVVRELLLGAPVFPEAGQTEMERLAAMASPRLLPLAALRPGLPVPLTDALDRGLSPEPDRRSVTAEEMVSLLRSVLDVELARARLVAFVARLRRAEAPRAVAHATRPDTSASLFDESSHDLETDADTTADAPPFTVASSMVMAKAQPVCPPTVGGAPPLAPRAAPTAPITVPLLRAAPVAPPTPPTRPGFDARASAPLRLDTPSAMVTPLPAPPRTLRRRTSAPVFLVAAAAAAIGMGIAIGGALGLRERAGASASSELRAPPPAPAPSEPPAGSATPAPAPPLAAAAPAPVSAAAAAPALTTGRLVTPPSEAGHRVFIDGRLAGSGGAPLVVRCGKHDVRVGSAGRLRHLEVPCGGDVEVSR